MKRLAKLSGDLTELSYQDVVKLAKRAAKLAKCDPPFVRERGKNSILVEVVHPSFNSNLDFEFIFSNIEGDDGSSSCIVKDLMKVYSKPYELEIMGRYLQVKNHIYFRKNLGTGHFGSDVEKVLRNIWDSFSKLLERDLGFEYSRNDGFFVRKFD